MMTTATIANAVLSLILVVCLILLTAQLFKWWQSERGKPARPGFKNPDIGLPNSLDIIETRAIDFKRKLVLVRRGDRLHLLLCGEGRDIVVETGIPYQVPMHDPASPDTKQHG
ncbi:MAG TPA: flagellar biosynthetic protein FliO [Alphaproteobacteria bacterium]|nr:flagellar biosynthetic protein FliO [Alphaproteobacteria bacterium]